MSPQVPDLSDNAGNGSKEYLVFSSQRSAIAE